MENIITRISKEFNQHQDIVRKEMEHAIHATMKNTDPATKTERDKLFQNNQQPTPEEFIAIVAAEVRRRLFIQ